MTTTNTNAPADAEIHAAGVSADAARDIAKKALPALLAVYLLGELMVQAFKLVYQNIGASFGMHAGASLLATIPGIVLAVLSLLYDSLCDFISPKRMTIIGVVCLIIGSIIGFFGQAGFWVVLAARILQVIGSQVAGSVYLVLVVKYLRDHERSVYIGVFGAVYYLASVAGILAGGLVAMVPWRFLFLIPALAIFCLPALVRHIPDITDQARHIDYVGMVTFAAVAMLISIYFDYPHWGWLAALGVLAVFFCCWVAFGKQPFLSRSFVKNGSFMAAVLVIVFFDFFSDASIPIYRVIGKGVYHISLTTVSLYLALVYALTAVVSSVIGKVVQRIGRWNTIFWSSVLMVVGFALSALFVRCGFWTLTAFACVYNIGIIGGYSPLYDCATAALPQEERGRGMGVAELTLNTSSAIGITVYASLMTKSALASHGWGIGLDAPAAPVAAAANRTSNMFWIMAAVALATVLLIVVLRRRLVDGGRVRPANR